MPGGERSQGACWTCKLRKKKCDQSYPSCAACLSLGITCHGYGPRPAWMDGGSAEKAKVAAWRQKVKETTNLKRKFRAHQNAPRLPQTHHSPENDRSINIPSSVEGAQPIPQSLPSGPSLNEVYSTNLSKARISHWLPGLAEDVATNDDRGTVKLPILKENELDCVGPIQSPPVLGEKEAGLLMHYVDYVFPLQFPFYKHSVIEGGRGWLLSILLELEPLYHAALSVSAYHMHFEVLAHEYELQFGNIQNAREMPACSRLQSQLAEHILTISRISKLLHRLGALESSSSGPRLPQYVELLACVATLISLEVLEGISDSWKVHLNAASYILPLAHEAFRSDQVKDLSNTHKEAYRFFSTALTWYKFQSCAAIGTLLETECAEFRLSNSCLPLSTFTGCEEWAIQGVLDIIKLASWKETMKTKNQLSIRELTTRASDIDTKLQREMVALSARIERSSHLDFFADPNAYTKLLVTRIYGYSALIYLYTVESGPCPDVPEIHANVFKIIDAFNALPQAETVRSLSWSLCIAGSMATGDQQTAFLDIAIKAKVNRRPFGSSPHALAIIKECWRMQGSESTAEVTVDWKLAMQSLGLNILLA